MQGFIDFLQTNGATLLELIATVIGVCSVAVGFSNKPSAQTASGWLLKVAKFFSAVTFKDEPGTLSVPLTDKDIVPK